MIKFALRQNLKYPLQALLWNVLRDIESILISHFLNVSDLAINCPLMFLGELLAGSIIYLYQKQLFSQNQNVMPTEYMHIKLIHTEQIFIKDSDIKILFLMFSGALCDFVEFKLFDCVYRYPNISGSIENRLRGWYTIFNALFYIFILGYPILTHQKFSLIVIGICIILVVLFEFIFQEINIFLSYGDLALAYFFVVNIHFYSALVDSIGKYLFEYNKINPFFELMFEGLFGFLISCLYCIFYSPFDEISKFRKSHSTSDFIVLIFSLFLYCFLSGGKNCFRVLTTKIFSPMTTTCMEYIFNPFYMIYYFVAGIDFIPYGQRNYLYFIINLIITFIVSFCGCVYNEFIILFFCGLEKDTHDQVVKRSIKEKELDNLDVEADDITMI